MDSLFWLSRWKESQIGFHQSDINPYLQQYLSELHLSPNEQVFVPLCGKSSDMSWLSEQGHPVLGVEISPIAVEDYFQEAHSSSVVTQRGSFKEYRSDNVQILCGDFFDLTSEDLRGIRGVYDRAALIALPAAMRKRYVEQLECITDPDIPILLITLEYPEDQMQGPPFSVGEKEVRSLFQKTRTVECLSWRPVLEDHLHFVAKGLTALVEAVYLLKPSA